jgi:hypothetical protein
MVPVVVLSAIFVLLGIYVAVIVLKAKAEVDAELLDDVNDEYFEVLEDERRRR